jgi:hypothetical protein
MRIGKSLLSAVACLALCGGCSEQTKTETKEALQQAGEAAQSAAEDTKANVSKAAGAVEDAAAKAKEKLNGSTTEPKPAETP